MFYIKIEGFFGLLLLKRENVEKRNANGVTQQRLMKSTEACCLLLLHPSPSPLLLLFPLNQQKWHWNPPSHFAITASASVSVARAHSFLAQPLYICRARSRKWDPNAESFRSQKLDYGYDEGGGDGGDDDEDVDDENDDTSEQLDDVLEEYIDSIWIFKVSLAFLLKPIAILNFGANFNLRFVNLF